METKLLELKTTVTERRNLPKKLNKRLKLAEKQKKTFNFEDYPIEIVLSEEKVKKIKRKINRY